MVVLPLAAMGADIGKVTAVVDTGGTVGLKITSGGVNITR